MKPSLAGLSDLFGAANVPPLYHDTLYSWSASAYMCGAQDYPGRDSADPGNPAGFALWEINCCTLPPYMANLSLVTIVGSRGTIMLAYRASCRMRQHNAVSHSTFTWRLTATLTLHLCPDQNLRHRCV